VVLQKDARYVGTVTSYYKWNGYGWVKLARKGIVVDDEVFVFWKSIQTEDRYPHLNKDMQVEFALHESEEGGKTKVRAKAVTLPGGLPVSIQDEADFEKKAFVGGQNVRFSGQLKYYSTKWKEGKVTLDDGYAIDAEVPKELRVEDAEVNCGGKQPFGMKDVPVEFGIWKNAGGKHKIYNMTMASGKPFTKEALENRTLASTQEFRGTVSVNMWKQGWGLITVSPTTPLPPQVVQKKSEDGVQLYFRESDVRENAWLKKGQEVFFRPYTDDKGAGACDIHPVA